MPTSPVLLPYASPISNTEMDQASSLNDYVAPTSCVLNWLAVCKIDGGYPNMACSKFSMCEFSLQFKR